MENLKEELRKRKYKDALPKDTIKKIRIILNNNGIIPIESNWINTVDGYFSVRLTMPETSLGANGKGTTHEYALASAYAELIERLQNMTQYRLTIDLRAQAHEYGDFYYCPDEKAMSVYDIIYSDEDWFKYQKKRLSDKVDIQELLKKWKDISYEQVPWDFITIPFMNLNTKRLSHIPIKMVSKMYMSNGMCAGNTTEEAIVQGVSECLERYVNKKVIEEQMTPPSYPEAYLRKYPRIFKMIKNIEMRGNKKVIIKDCSLGENLPVTAVIYIDKTVNSYFVKFGSHPIFEISVERALTELLQGQDINRMMGMTPFVYDVENTVSHENIMNILVNGVGNYPPALFKDHPSYPWQPFNEPEKTSNSELLKYLVKMLDIKGYDIYVRDVSFLGFPSFHVLIPGLSEIEHIYDMKQLDEYAQYVQVKKMMRNYRMLRDEKKKNLLKILESNRFFLLNISDILFIKLKKGVPQQALSVGWFVMAAYYNTGDYKKAHQVFAKWFSHFKNKKENMDTMSYYRCILNYLKMKSEKVEEEIIKNTLFSFYPTYLVERVCRNFGKEAKKTTGFVSCWHCEKCQLKQYCDYKKMEEVYLVLKNNLYMNNISQEGLRNII